MVPAAPTRTVARAVSLGSGPLRLAVTGTDRALLTELARAFGAAVPACPRRPLRGAAIRLGGRLPPRGRGVRVTCRGAPARSVRSLPELVAAVDELSQVVLGALVLEEGSDWLLLHASAAADPRGRGVVLVGPSGAGKSTTAALLAGAGWTYLGDECLVVAAAPPRILRWPRPIALVPDTLPFLADTRREGEHGPGPSKAVLPAPRRAGGAPRAAVRWHATVLLDRDGPPDGEAGSDAAFRFLLGNCHLFQPCARRAFPALAAISRETRCLHLRPAGGRAVVDRLVHLLEPA